MCEPDRARLEPDGTAGPVPPESRAGRAVASAALVFAGTLLVALAVAWVLGASGPEWFIAFVGAFAIGGPAGAMTWERTVRAGAPAPVDPPLRISVDDDIGHALCEQMWGIASTGAWLSGDVDRERCATLFWETVRRADRLAEQESVVHRAQGFASLDAVRLDAAERARTERAELTTVVDNLAEVRRNAEKIDRDRVEGARRREHERARRREEQELLAGLLDGAGSAVTAAEHADESAGLAAESAEIARSRERIERLLDDGGV